MHERLEQGWSSGRAWEPLSTQKDKNIHGTPNWTQRLMQIGPSWVDNNITDTSLTLERWMTALAREHLPLKSDTFSPSLSHATTRVPCAWETL